METTMADLSALAKRIDNGELPQARISSIAREVGAKDDRDIVLPATVSERLRVLDAFLTEQLTRA